VAAWPDIDRRFAGEPIVARDCTTSSLARRARRWRQMTVSGSNVRGPPAAPVAPRGASG
jgi:hypothetical protein